MGSLFTLVKEDDCFSNLKDGFVDSTNEYVKGDEHYKWDGTGVAQVSRFRTGILSSTNSR